MDDLDEVGISATKNKSRQQTKGHTQETRSKDGMTPSVDLKTLIILIRIPGVYFQSCWVWSNTPLALRTSIHSAGRRNRTNLEIYKHTCMNMIEYVMGCAGYGSTLVYKHVRLIRSNPSQKKLTISEQ